ncbi:MAG: histidinol dehydrogenase [Fidelibacterota bacterium]|nr:MAG: histidinol dehydrogenase [Candidatus Neomarinimicrobiota bacterium]
MITLPVITDPAQLAERLERRQRALDDTRAPVANILAQVREQGDDALRRFTREFDGAEIDDVRVPQQMLEKSQAALPAELADHIRAAIGNIRRFHELQLPAGFDYSQPDGTEVSWGWRSIERVGIYVPGGRYPLVSSLVMNVIPAQVAGVREIAVCSPPTSNGLPETAILGICSMLGIEEVYRLGGAQAIAALAYGTETVRAVDKITGPGNRYVTGAKQAVMDRVGIDMTAGPTEVVVLADESSDPRWAAADLISQAEHDPLAWPVMVTTSRGLAEKVNELLGSLLDSLPTRRTAEASLRNHGFIYLAENPDAGVEIVNRIAPEHLCLQVAEPERLRDRCKAGVIFLGGHTPTAWGDYWAGPNHTLPTGGQVRYRGPLSVLDFMTPSSVIQAGPQAVRRSGSKVRALANLEGLAGHALSVAVREGEDA